MSDPIKPELTTLNPPERSRTYHYPDGDTFVLIDVVAFGVRPSGAHRLETKDGRKWVVMPGWVVIELDVDSWTL